MFPSKSDSLEHFLMFRVWLMHRIHRLWLIPYPQRESVKHALLNLFRL